jgi:hypothetical protein
MAGTDGATARTEAWPEIADQDAGHPVLAAFEDMRSVLRTPFVDQLWRVLAAQPDFLVSAWGWLAPILGSRAAEEAADSLRHASVIQLALGVPAHKAFRGDLSRWEVGPDDRARISNYNMAEQYYLPKVLLAAELLLLELRPDSEPPALRGAPSEALTRGVAQGMPPVAPMDPAQARGDIVTLFEEIRRRHGYDQIADYYRTIARAGDFLRLAWNALRPVVGDPEYVSQAGRVVQRTRRVCSELRTLATGALPVRPAAGRDLVAALTFYRNQLLPKTLVELTIVKGLTDGPESAPYNSYSLTEAPPASGG